MKLEKSFYVSAGACDHRAKLSIPYLFVLFMDAATEHSETMGIGKEAMDKTGLFWITVRTKMKIFELPSRMTEVTVATWPEAPGRIRCNRYYTLTAGEKMLVEAKTEWAIIDLNSGMPQKIHSIYPENLDHLSDTVCDGPFLRVSADFADAEVMDTYQIRSTDIDFGRHMNNAAYLRALFGVFTCKELEEMEIKEVEVAFKSQSYEGEVLTIYRRHTETGSEYGMVRPNGDVAVIVRIS